MDQIFNFSFMFVGVSAKSLFLCGKNFMMSKASFFFVFVFWMISLYCPIIGIITSENATRKNSTEKYIIVENNCRDLVCGINVPKYRKSTRFFWADAGAFRVNWHVSPVRFHPNIPREGNNRLDWT